PVFNPNTSLPEPLPDAIRPTTASTKDTGCHTRRLQWQASDKVPTYEINEISAVSRHVDVRIDADFTDEEIIEPHTSTPISVANVRVKRVSELPFISNITAEKIQRQFICREPWTRGSNKMAIPPSTRVFPKMSCGRDSCR